MITITPSVEWYVFTMLIAVVIIDMVIFIISKILNRAKELDEADTFK